MAPGQMETQTFKESDESVESPAIPGCATPNLFGHVDEATQYYAMHGPPCQLWPVPSLVWHVWPAFPEVQDQKVQTSGEDTPTYLGTFEQSQRLWEASGRPSVQPLPPPEIQRVLDVVAEQQREALREALRAQHQKKLLALEPVVAERAAEEAEEAKEAEVAEPALENVEPLSHQDAEPTMEVPSVPSESELPRASSMCSTASSICCSNLNGKAPKFRPGMEECPYVAIGQSCRTSQFSGFGRCKSYLEGKCTRKKCKFCHCEQLQFQWSILDDVKH